MFWFLTTALGHPFEAELYGHDMHVVLQNRSINLAYRLEVPFEVVQKELTLMVANHRDHSMEALRSKYLKETYDDIADSLSLQVDGVDMSWDTAGPISDKLKKEDRFLIFELHASKKMMEGARQISILNRNHEQKLSIYRSTIEYEGGFWIDNTDLDNPKQWSKEESMKELRMSLRILPTWWASLEQQWKRILKQEILVSHSNIEESWKDRFKRGVLLFHEAVLGLLFSVCVFLAAPMARNKKMVGLLSAMIGFGLLCTPLYDTRIIIFSIMGVLAFPYPAVLLVLMMSIALPWWFSVLGFLTFVRTGSLKKAWLLSIGLSLAFFYMFI